MKRCALTAVVVAEGFVIASAGCGAGGWYDVYGGERCNQNGEIMELACNDKWSGANCGGRLQHGGNIGEGELSMGIKAAPGNGVITSFYLSNNGGMYAAGTSWNEIDFEIMGMQASPTGTRVWTNFFTGSAEEHHGFRGVPFDVTADEHIYSFKTNSTHIQWLVDGSAIRTDDITQWGDMKGAIAGSTFQGYASVWGTGNSDPDMGACQEFMDGLGKLDDNPNGFPVHSYLRAVDSIPTTSPPPTPPPETPPPAAPAALAAAAPVPGVDLAAAYDPAATYGQQQPAVAYGQAAYGQAAYGQPAYGQAAYGQPAAQAGYAAGWPQAKFDARAAMNGKAMLRMPGSQLVAVAAGLAVAFVMFVAMRRRGGHQEAAVVPDDAPDRTPLFDESGLES